MIEQIDRFDDAVDRWWDETLRGRPPVDRIFYAASEAADFSRLWHIAGAIQAAVERDHRVSTAVSTALAVEAALVNGPIKAMFRRNRPVEDRPRPHNLRQPRTSSFPSGHASAAMVAAAMLSRRGGAPFWYGVGGVVAVSRVHVRIHHASDVIGGAVVGVALGAVARRIADTVFD